MDEIEAGKNPKNLILVQPKKKKPFWVTATIASNIGREELLAATLREIIFHLLSLIILSIYIFSQTDETSFYITESLKKSFRTETELEDVITVDKFWAYVNEIVIPEIYGYKEVEAVKNKKEPEESKNNEKIKDFVLNAKYSTLPLVIANENFLLGVPRIRQVKVNDHSCEIHGYFRRLFHDCFNFFTYFNEDQAEFGAVKDPETAWFYSPATITKSVNYWGILTTYSGGGFYADFSLDVKETLEIIGKLEDNLWITRGTRAIFIDFSVYNVNANLYCICKLIFELLPTGGIIPNYQFTSATLTPFPDNWNWVLRVLLYIFTVYIGFCLIEEFREILHFKSSYFLLFWNYVDTIVIILTLLLVIGTELMRIGMEPFIKEILNNRHKYGNLEYPKMLYQFVQISGAILLFLIYLRTFKYLNFNRRMAQLNNTIRNCAKDILGFSVMFFVAYFAYAELGYLVFGNETNGFRSFGQSMFTLLRAILGDFAYDDIHKANWIVAPIYFLTFIILIFFILLNMFLAIINDTYADVKIDIALAPKEIQMTEYILKKYYNFLRKLGCKVKKESGKQLFIDTSLNKVREALIKCGFDDREIEMYFTRYDVDPLNDLKQQDIEEFFEKLAKEDVSRQRGEENIVTWKDFQKQDDKLVELENTLVMVGQKVQDLIKLIENLPRTQPK